MENSRAQIRLIRQELVRSIKPDPVDPRNLLSITNKSFASKVDMNKLGF